MASKKQQKVRVLRAFYRNGEVMGRNSVYVEDVDRAVEYRGQGKVEFVQADEKPQRNSEPKPVTDATVSDDGKTDGGKKDSAK